MDCNEDDETMVVQKKKLDTWSVLIASCWVEATAGITYVFGTYSSVLKSSLGYDQRHVNKLSVAKDLGDTVGLAAGFLCSALFPSTWPVLLLGAAHILFGYGFLWLFVAKKVSLPPFWTVCVLIFLGTNGCTYLDTAALVSSIETLPRSRGMVVGLLKGFKGLCGAIFNQVYTSFLAPNESNFILMLALGPPIVVLPLLLLVKPVLSITPSSAVLHAEATTFKLLYGISVVLAAYMLSVTLIQDLVTVSVTLNIVFTVGLLVILLFPVLAPVLASLFTRTSLKEEVYTRTSLLKEKLSSCERSELEEVSCNISGSSTAWQCKVDPLISRELRRTDIHRCKLGDDFTLLHAVGDGDFWLLFVGLCLGSGSGVTAINNLGQIAEAQGYSNIEFFVSLTNIWNFAGRLAGGYASEYVFSNFGLPRSMVLAVAQTFMAIGHIFLAMAWPYTMYVATLLIGAGYGAHWGIFPAMLSELFGLKNFSVLYGFVCMAIPAGSLVFSGLIAGTLYDWEARKQSSASSDDSSLTCEGTTCFRITFLIMTGVCLAGVLLNLILAYRVRILYYGLQRRPLNQLVGYVQ